MREPTLMSRRGLRSADDSLIPLINIVFLLLIFFMVAGQIAQPQDADIRPPSSISRLALEPAEIELSMKVNGALMLDGVTVDPDTLERRLNSLASEESAVRVSLRADRDATASELDKVFTLLRELGVSTITLHSLYSEAE
ncbi:biopolymer transporter ExbD [Pseudomonas sp. gcc21]|uniref:ExbD/TolR family protein n=1 Tax=Pseudomonas sp. gcc21 TaxID=2726989 RepID=UPI001451BADE|nr:biopolymer transporter ExbD [Pseudomonas sp. gcc21]QJD58137.1 biopolymer transporter ExbD [Pseudomonas sp. gcc21]